MHLSSVFRLAAHGARALSSQSSLCINGPVIPLEAGVSALSATVDSPLDGRCEASLQFSDPTFLPIRFSFDPIPCDGQQINNFTVPRGVPNGEVEVIWQCIGLAPTCSRAVISGGDADTSILADNPGMVGCVSEILQTKTTIATITQSTGIAIETFPTVITSSTTSYHTLTESTTTDGTAESTTLTITRSTDTAIETLPAVTSSITSYLTWTESITADETSNSGSDLPDTAISTAPDVNITPTTAATGGSLTSSVATNSITMASNGDTSSDSPDPEPTDDGGVFVSSASRTTLSLTTILTMSLVSTFTVTRTVTAECTAA